MQIDLIVGLLGGTSVGIEMGFQMKRRVS